LWQPPTSHEWRPADEPLGGKGEKLHDAKIKKKNMITNQHVSQKMPPLLEVVIVGD